jgi:hypothetical protein
MYSMLTLSVCLSVCPHSSDREIPTLLTLYYNSSDAHALHCQLASNGGQDIRLKGGELD